MNPELMRKLAAVPERQLHLAGGGLLLIAAAAFWFYGFKAPLAELRAVRAEQARLEAGGGDPALLRSQKAALDNDVGQLSRQLGAGPASPAAQQVVDLVGAVSRLAAIHGVAVDGANPAPELKTMVFEQAGIDIDASGSYEALLAWMAAVEAAQPNLSIDRFDMRAGAAPGQIQAKVRVATFRPLEASQ